jgi:hypothetical protein
VLANDEMTDVLSDVQPVLAEGVTFIYEELGNAWCSPLYSRQVTYGRRRGVGYQHWPAHVDGLFTKFVIAGAGVVAAETDGADNPEPAAEEVVRTYLGEEAESPELQFLGSKIVEAVTAARRAQELSDALVSGLGQTMATDEGRFTLMTYLAAPMELPQRSSTAPQEDREIQALQLLDTFAGFGDEDRSMSTPIADGLREGSFDDLLAEAVLDSAREDYAPVDTPTKRETDKLVELGVHLLGEERDAVIARLATAEARDLWPEAAVKMFDIAGRDFGDNLRLVRQYYRSFLTAHRCVPVSVATTEDITRSAEDILFETAKVKSTDTQTPMQQRLKARRVVDTMEQKRRRRQTAERTAIDEALDPKQDGEASAAEVQPQIRRNLVYVRPDGSQAPEDSPECQRVFDDYHEVHRDRHGLKQDLENIREWLKTVDLSAGIPRGIKTLGGGQTLKRGSAEFSKIYQLKPSEAVGLSIASGLGSKIRVLFVMENNTIGILGISQRDKVRNLMREVGVRGRSRRK